MPSRILARSAWIIIAVIGPLTVFSDHALAQPYYLGKTLTVIRGGSPGGVGDLQTRALIPFLKKYIPGNPTIIIEHMPGAAGMKAVNYIYSTAKPDGLHIGAVGAGLVAGAVLRLPGVMYEMEKLVYLGSTDTGDPHLFTTRNDPGFETLEKLRAASGIRIGAQTVGHPQYVSGRIFAYLLGLQDPKFVVGYGGPELDVALMRGEVDARSKNVDSILTRNLQELQKGLLKVHAAITIPKGKAHPRFADVPEIEIFARTETDLQLLNLFRTFLYPRWPYFLPPDTRSEIVKILRDATVKAFNDPGFSKEFKKLMGNDRNPLTGEAFEAAIRELPRDPQMITLYKRLAEGGPLPSR
jgi:tripartite-type tricarboxylate transporter receptor subunit TctC